MANQRAAARPCGRATVSFSHKRKQSSCQLLFPAVAAVTLLEYTSTIPSPSNSNPEAACPFSSFVQAAAFQSPLLRALSLSAFSSHPHFRIHIEPTPCRGPSKISSSTTMKKRHVLSVLRSSISQIEVSGPASVAIRFVLTACTGNTLAS